MHRTLSPLSRIPVRRTASAQGRSVTFALLLNYLVSDILESSTLQRYTEREPLFYSDERTVDTF
jgi:hypothetical protein